MSAPAMAAQAVTARPETEDAGALAVGAILIKSDALLPESLRIEREPALNGWTFVRNLDRGELEREIANAGWTLFFMAGEVRNTVVAFNQRKASQRALKRIIDCVQSEGFNCIEVTHISVEQFVGVPYLTLGGHARHIQRSTKLTTKVSFRDGGGESQ
jgi:hypothetical protein